MTGGSWLCLLAPLVGTILILLGGSWLPRVAAAWIATTSVFVAFGGAIWAFLGVHSQAPQTCLSSLGTVSCSPAWRDHDRVDVARVRPFQRRPAAARRPAEHDDDADRRRRRRADRPLLDRLHGRRRRGAPLLRLHRVLRLLDAAARRGRQPAHAARRLGARRALLLPADRLLARAAERGSGGEEGVHHECVRRRDDGARLLHPHRAHELAVVRSAQRSSLFDAGESHRTRPARRRGGEVGADPAPDVAARRDGRPHAGQRPHPRGDHGDGRRLPDRAHASSSSSRRGRSSCSPPARARSRCSSPA